MRDGQTLKLIAAGFIGGAIVAILAVFIALVMRREVPPNVGPKPSATSVAIANPAALAELDESPITGSDRQTKADYFVYPLSVGMVGLPYSVEIVTVIDEANAIAVMRMSNGFTANVSKELVWAVMPTRGMVSAHKYYITKKGAIPTIDDVSENEKLTFKVVGTRNYTTASGGELTVYVVKPLK